MRKLLSVALLVATAGLVCADPPAVDIPATIAAPTSGYLTVQPKTDAASVVYIAPNLDPFPSQFLADKTTLLIPVRGVPAGTYPCYAVAASKTGEQKVVNFVIVVGTPTPTPGPGPGPNPNPDPDPFSGMQAKQDTPDPYGAGSINSLHVLIVEDTAKRTTLSQGQVDVLFGQDVKNYLRAKAPATPDSPAGGWNIWSKTANVAGAPQVWQSAFKYANAHAKSYPYMVISNGKNWTAGSIPADITPAKFNGVVAKYAEP